MVLKSAFLHFLSAYDAVEKAGTNWKKERNIEMCGFSPEYCKEKIRAQLF